MAKFELSYPIIKKNEGYYCWIPGDAGGETYGGIARNIFPNWEGWKIVDAYKAEHITGIATPANTLRNNTPIPEADSYVTVFYQNWYNRLGCPQINDQSLADIIFDFIVNSGSTGILETETVLDTKFGWPIKADRTFDADTIKAINSLNPINLFNAILDERKAFYKRISEKQVPYTVKTGDTASSIATHFGVPIEELPQPLGNSVIVFPNRKFYQPWLNRLANSFKTK